MSQINSNWKLFDEVCGLGLCYSFTTSAEHVRDCDGPSPQNQCLGAVQHVEEIVDTGDNPNATCDGGVAELANSASNAELMAKLTARASRVIPWLKTHAGPADEPARLRALSGPR